MRHLLALTLALVSIADAHAQMAGVGDISFTGDSDRFYSYRERLGALWNYQSYLDYRGIAAQATHYTQAGWHQDGQGLIGFWRQQERTTLTGINAEGGVVRVAGHTRAVGDATWGWRPGAHTGVELIAAGDLVETQAAINRGVAYGFYGASIEQQLVPRLTAIGLVGYQPFTDDRMVIDEQNTRTAFCRDEVSARSLVWCTRRKGNDASRIGLCTDLRFHTTADKGKKIFNVGFTTRVSARYARPPKWFVPTRF